MPHGLLGLKEYEDDPLGFAVKVWIDRNTQQRTKEGGWVYRRRFPPSGVRVSGVSGKRGPWIPQHTEVRACCQSVAIAGWIHPWHVYRHCCSARHVAHLLYVDESALREAIKPYGKGFKLNECPECAKVEPMASSDYICIKCRGQEVLGVIRKA